MATSIMEPGMTAEVSSTVAVEDGSSKLITLYTVDGTEIPYGIIFALERQTINGFFETVSISGVGRVILSKDSKSVLLTGIGVYRVKRPDISAFEMAVGVQEG